MKDAQTTEAMEFQGTILNAVNQHLGPYMVNVEGIPFWMFPNTFNPNYAKAARLLLQNLDAKPEDTVLDMFAGPATGAIVAAEKYGTEKAVAVEKFDWPYLCGQYNILNLGLENQVEIRQGDVWGAIHPDEKFSLIVANPPFKRMEAHTDMEAALRDGEYNALDRFVEGIPSHLTEGGRARIVFASVGELDYLEHLFEENNLQHTKVAEEKYANLTDIVIYEVQPT